MLLALLTCGIPVFWMHFEANHCNAFALMLLTCGIPKLRMRSRQIFSTSLVAGLRIHAVWMRCKLLQFGRRNVYLLGYWPAANLCAASPSAFCITECICDLICSSTDNTHFYDLPLSSGPDGPTILYALHTPTVRAPSWAQHRKPPTVRAPSWAQHRKLCDSVLLRGHS